MSAPEQVPVNTNWNLVVPFQVGIDRDVLGAGLLNIDFAPGSGRKLLPPESPL
jgi:hypothetical protein